MGWARLPDDRLLLGSASADDSVRVWSPAAGDCVQVLILADEVDDFAFGRTPDGRLVLAVGCHDRRVHLWSTGPPPAPSART